MAGIVGCGLSAFAAAPNCPPREAPRVEGGAALRLDARASPNALHILAIGSSSTEGVGATAYDRSYPARLYADLQADGFTRVEVHNAGVGGEAAQTTLSRLEAALAGHWPGIVIWLVGANDGLIGVDETRFRATVEKGVRDARDAGASIVLVDPQYTLRERAAARLAPYAAIVDQIAADERAPVAERYASMRALSGNGQLAPMLSKDGLHMSDLGYDCLAASLANLIEHAAGGPPRIGLR